MIKRNIALCKKCNQVIESKHVHDFVVCECGNVSLDGGAEYTRVMVKDLKSFKYLGDDK